MSKFVILHTRKTPYLDLLYNESQQTLQYLRKKGVLAKAVYHIQPV